MGNAFRSLEERTAMLRFTFHEWLVLLDLNTAVGNGGNLNFPSHSAYTPEVLPLWTWESSSVFRTHYLWPNKQKGVRTKVKIGASSQSERFCSGMDQIKASSYQTKIMQKGNYVIIEF